MFAVAGDAWQSFGLAMLHASIQASVLALLVWMLVRIAGTSISPRLRYALWCLVALRLAMPVSLPDPFGLTRPGFALLWSVEDAEPPGEDRRPPAVPDSKPRDEASDEQLAFVAELGGRVARSDSVAPELRSEEQATGPGAGATAAIESDPAQPRAAEPAPQGSTSSAGARGAEQGGLVGAETLEDRGRDGLLGLLGLALWGLGALVVLLRTLRGELLFRRRVLGAASRIEGDPLLEEARREVGVKRSVALLSSPDVNSPGAWGLLRPVILVPSGDWERLDRCARRFVLRHELAHIAAHDPSANLVLRVLAALHWWNPVAWFALSRLRDERELLRDLQALRTRPALDARACAQALIDMTPRRAAPTAPSRPAMATFTPRRRFLIRERVQMILFDRPFSVVSTTCGLLSCAVLGWLGFANAPVDESDSPNAQASPPVAAEPSGGNQASAGRAAATEIRVVRAAEPTAWEIALQKKLDERVQWAQPLRPVALLEELGRRSGIRFVIDDDFSEEIEEIPELPAAPAPIRFGLALDVLRWHLRTHGRYSFWNSPASGRIEFSERAKSGSAELRYYDVRPLVQAANTIGDDLDLLLELIQTHVGGFDEEGRSLNVYRGRLLVRHTPHAHEELRRFLDQLATGRDPDAIRVDPGLVQKLGVQVEIDREATRPALLRELAKKHGIGVFLSEGLASDEEPLRFRKSAPLGVAMSEVAGTHLTLRENVVFLGGDIPLTTRVHDVSDIVMPTERAVLRSLELDEEEVITDSMRRETRASILSTNREQLNELIQHHVLPRTWDELAEAGIRFWNGLLVVRQSEPGHAALRRFLEMTRRALK